MPDFHMTEFLSELEEKREELDGDVFDMLYTLSGKIHSYRSLCIAATD